MADPQGFLKIRARELPGRRPVPVRIQDWREVYEQQDRGELQRQASRCMDCGIPFCHNGCPLGNLIPEWNDLVWRGDWRGAIERLHATNNFPEFTGRLCPAPCETACVLGINQPAVTIKQVEVTTIEEAFARGGVPPHPPERQLRQDRRRRRLGSRGPGGRAAAHPRRAHGRRLRAGRPARWPAALRHPRVQDGEVGPRPAAGPDADGGDPIFRSGVNIGEDITGHQLRHRYDAVVLAIGSTVPRDLPVPGRELDGVLQAMEYLPPSNRASLGESVEGQVTAEGKDVVVIGGGDTGADCIGTAHRQGARSVTSLEIMPQPRGDPAGRPAVADLPDPSTASPRPTRRVVSGSTP